MKNTKFVIILICIFFLTGCIFFRKNPKKLMKVSYGSLYDVKSGQIINSSFLKGGKYVLVIPFKAGTSVAATEGLDKVSLMIVRGVYDVLKEENSRLEVLGADKIEKGDFLIEGHIKNMHKLKRLSKWILLRKKMVLGVQGRVTDIKTGDMILRFEDEIISNTSKHSYKDLGHLIGKNIGRFLMHADGVKKASQP